MSAGRRRHASAGVPPLEALPLDAAGVAAVRFSRATTTGSVRHCARVTTCTPTLADGRTPARPSPVLAHALELEETGPRADVRFEFDGHTTRAQVELPAAAALFGAGEWAGGLRTDGRLVLFWNTDAWCYDDATPALYQSHPYVLALLEGGRARGILADCCARGTLAASPDGVELAFEGGPFEVHLIEADSPQEVQRALAAIVGRPALPPLWALGYHQSRYSYESADEVRALARRLRAERVPCDAVWLDIDYMDRFRSFTWDPERFPDPRALTAELRAAGLRTVAILDPGIAAAADDPTYASGLAGEHFVEDASGRPVRGRVWPGLCAFPDFTRSQTRAWWAGRVARFVAESGVAGLWNDMNEPSVFRTPTRTLPESARHRGMGGGSHARFHNLYGQLMTEATRAGLAAAAPDERPFVLTRSTHLAGARFAATWTGDNQSRWEDLAWAVPMILRLGLCGQPFAGADLGGFLGAPSEELFVRWYELAAFMPFARGHAEKESPRQEPWSFGAKALAHVRAALSLRMRLLPALFTLAREAHAEGLPLWRPAFFADPADARLREVEDAFLLGDDLYVAPVLHPGATERDVVLPRSPGGWLPFPEGGAAHVADAVRVPAPLGRAPLFARAGSITVLGAERMHVGEPDELREWHAFLDPAGRARGTLAEEGIASPLELEVVREADEVVASVHGRGHAPRKRRLIVHGLGEAPRVFEDDGAASARFRLV